MNVRELDAEINEKNMKDDTECLNIAFNGRGHNNGGHLFPRATMGAGNKLKFSGQENWSGAGVQSMSIISTSNLSTERIRLSCHCS